VRSTAKTVVVAAAVVGGLCASAYPESPDTCEPQRVISPPSIGTPDFGHAVATDGTQWFVASSDANTLCSGPAISCSTGAVFVYDEIDGRLELAQTIVPPDAELYDNFGQSVDVDSGRLVVGSLFTRNPTTDQRTGAVFVYEHDGVEWVEVDRVWPPPSVPEEFAKQLVLHGESLIVTTQRGRSAEVYAWDTARGWLHLQTVTQPDPDGPATGFGVQWAARDDWFATGAYLDKRTRPNGGALFIFRREASGMLELVQEFVSDESMRLGYTVDFLDDVLVVGAPLATRAEQYQGAVRFYSFDGSEWAFTGELTHEEPRENRQFGARVLSHGNSLYVRALDERTPVSYGMVYGYERDATGSWVAVDRFVPESAHFADLYGSGMASNGASLLIGARHDRSATGGVVGAAYFFDLACGDCQADLDADGSLTIFDFLTFLNLFQDGDALADFDGDGELTIFDFLAFQTAFDAGCG
jgi:hypothetical protein